MSYACCGRSAGVVPIQTETLPVLIARGRICVRPWPSHPAIGGRWCGGKRCTVERQLACQPSIMCPSCSRVSSSSRAGSR
jgi:hypothetical protein